MSDDVKQLSSPCGGKAYSRESAPESPGCVKERAVILERPNASLVGTVFVDDKCAISEALVEGIRHKAFLLTSSFLLEPEFGVREIVKIRGQVGVIRQESLPNSPDPKRAKTSENSLMDPTFRRYAVAPFTARNKIKNQRLRNENGEYMMGAYHDGSMVSSGSTGEMFLEFSDGGNAPAAKVEVRKAMAAEGLDPIVWNLVDITKAQTIGSAENHHKYTKSAYSFSKAKDYSVAPGHKIGIVVYRYWDIPSKDAMWTGTEQAWETKRGELFGEKSRPCVYTGSIVRVSPDGKTFEHNINSFKGCSGAVIFLLDKNQPDGLATRTALGQSLCGAAIGIHVGAPNDEIEGSNVNIGFLLP